MILWLWAGAELSRAECRRLSTQAHSSVLGVFPFPGPDGCGAEAQGGWALAR